ncbi:hypothetical protein SUGI_0094930 [Cryptomeria japonica]|nr:hypothetical protein SUGI_0094930 [Cryptomeria japonica]
MASLRDNLLWKNQIFTNGCDEPIKLNRPVQDCELSPFGFWDALSPVSDETSRAVATRWWHGSKAVKLQ